MIGSTRSAGGRQKLLALLVTFCLLLSLVPISGYANEASAEQSPSSSTQSGGSADDSASDQGSSAGGQDNGQSDTSSDDASASSSKADDAGSAAGSEGEGGEQRAAVDPHAAAANTVEPNASEGEPVAPLANEIARLTGSVTTTPTNPLSGASFKMTIEMNSISEGASTTEGIRDAQVSFTIPNNVEIQSLPTTNGQYTVSPANPQPGDTVTITYNNELSVGSLHKLEAWFRFPAGVSLPSESFEPVIDLSASNAFSHTMTPDEVNPANNPLGTVMQVTPQNINPIFLHSATIDLTREAYLGGLNQNDASVTIEFPGDAEVLSVVYKDVEYPVVDDGSGGKVATVPIGLLGVGNQNDKETITVLYSYPPMTAPGETQYQIDVTYTATRFDGTPITETGSISETVSYQNGGADANAFFMKHAVGQVYRTGDQAVSFELDYTPYADMKGATLTDDPLRAGEANFFDAVEYRTVTWVPYAILDPSRGETVRTQMLYQTASDPGVWRAAGSPSATGRVNIDSLGLAAGDYVTQVQFKFFGATGDEVTAGSSPVKIRILGTTTDGIVNTGTSYDDNALTNGAYMTGEIRFPGSSTYSQIEDEGIKNARTTTTNVVANNPEVGLAGWESPSSPNPIIPGKDVSFSVRHYITNSVLRDATSYLIVDPNIEILDMELDSRFPDATWSVSVANNGYQLVSITWNGDITSAWTQYSVNLKGIAKPGIGSEAYFRYLVASDDPTQQYSGGGAGVVNSWYLNRPADWAIIDALADRAYGSTYRWGIPVDNGLGLNPQKLASVNGSDYALTQTTDTSLGARSGYFSLSATNTESTNLEEVRIIDMLPVLGDTMALSSNAKKSTAQLQVDSMTDTSGAALSSAFELYYSEDATPATNQIDLTDFSGSSGATWTPWDGASALPSTAKAVMLVKTDGLNATDSFEVRLNVTIPENAASTTLVGWNAMSAGGKHAGGYIVPGEPHKSGIYISKSSADKKLAGILWEDADGNDTRDASEPVYANKIVRLYDWDDSLVAQTTTDAVGHYEFDRLLPERYRVEIDLPVNLEITGYQAISDKEVDNDFVRADTYLASATVNLATESHPENVDGGFYTKASIGDYVWEDTDGNGVQDSHEPGFENAKVTLYRMNGSVAEETGSMTTSAGGAYSFTGLKPGTYKVAIEPLSTHIPTDLAVGGAGAENDSKLKDTWETDELALASGDARSDVDAGLTGALDGTVTLTKVDHNGDGLADAVFGIWPSGADVEADEPLKTATSQADGSVTFADLASGEYQVKEITAPAGFDADSAVHQARIVSNLQLNVDLGTVANTLSLGTIALTKTDGDGAALAGATFGLWLATADPALDDPLETAESGQDGTVVFTDKAQGSYLVKEIAAPEGYVMSEDVHQVTLDRTTLSFDIGQVMNQKVEDPTPPDPPGPVDPIDPVDPTDPADPADPSNPAASKPAATPSGAAWAATGDSVLPLLVAIGALAVLALGVLAGVAIRGRSNRR
ncbi:MSCRAMM family protein [Raoultibacter phocaeensis]|uniref:MSCRAMM family protein n=1 Tax=Raoultibacter phocaeensis TaxID=2479841 RepID=UPI0011195E21|nr:SdrD B-like domain-containing protein [Raoultibacter phocaeensis]